MKRNISEFRKVVGGMYIWYKKERRKEGKNERKPDCQYRTSSHTSRSSTCAVERAKKTLDFICEKKVLCYYVRTSGKVEIIGGQAVLRFLHVCVCVCVYVCVCSSKLRDHTHTWSTESYGVSGARMDGWDILVLVTRAVFICLSSI